MMIKLQFLHSFNWYTIQCLYVVFIYAILLPILNLCFKAYCPFLCVRPKVKDNSSVRLLYLAGEDLTIFFALHRILDHFIKMSKQLFREKKI